MTPVSGPPGNRLHLAVAVCGLWLVATSPWLGMLRRIPASAGWLDYAHVAVGFGTLLLGAAFAWSCIREERRALYFPWSPAGLRTVAGEIGGLLRGRIPAAEGGGLIGFLEGLLLVALTAAAATGAIWFLMQGGDAALTWREHHLVAAHVFVALLVLHVLSVSLHVLEFARS
jgi:hypothetical protein